MLQKADIALTYFLQHENLLHAYIGDNTCNIRAATCNTTLIQLFGFMCPFTALNTAFGSLYCDEVMVSPAKVVPLLAAANLLHLVSGAACPTPCLLWFEF